MIFSLLLLALLPHLTLAAYVNVGIVNGTEAKAHSRPYMVSVQRGGRHICGGFLVSERFVMTAAHCYTDGHKLTVVVGAHDLSKSSARRVVKSYNIHPRYDAKNFLNDIMILELIGTTQMVKNVKSISIPNKEKDTKAGSKCSVAGWGKQTTNGSPTDRLMEVDVTVIDTKECQKKWKEKSSRIVCALGPGGFCQGDSGGPLVCEDTAVGVVSFTRRTTVTNQQDRTSTPRFPHFCPGLKLYLRV